MLTTEIFLVKQTVILTQLSNFRIESDAEHWTRRLREGHRRLGRGPDRRAPPGSDALPEGRGRPCCPRTYECHRHPPGELCLVILLCVLCWFVGILRSHSLLQAASWTFTSDLGGPQGVVPVSRASWKPSASQIRPADQGLPNVALESILILGLEFFCNSTYRLEFDSSSVRSVENIAKFRTNFKTYLYNFNYLSTVAPLRINPSLDNRNYYWL